MCSQAFTALARAFLYACAGAGRALERRGRQVRAFFAAFSFCLANISLMVGLVEALRYCRNSAFRSQGWV